MQKQTTSYFCDICKKETEKDNVKSISRMPVIFTTEQTEGRSVEPYLDFVSIDICNKCLAKSIKIKASGAMGYNNYRIVD